MSSSDGVTPLPFEVDPSSGGLIVTAISSTNSLPSTLRNGQQTATTSAVALSSGSLRQGVVIQALSTNTVSVFVGGSSVTASTGIELPPGSAVSVLVNNTNVIYIICASSSPVVTWLGS